MATNYIQDGCVLALPAPAALSAGAGALVGSIFGVSLNALSSGEVGSFHVVGVWRLPKLSAQAWTVGEQVYWDDTNKEVTTVSTSNTLIGVAVEAAANPSAVGVVRLNGAF